MIGAFFVLLAVASASVARTYSLPKIILGENANEGEYPFIVSIRRNDSYHGLYCGGNILTSNWMVTAAHCCPEGYEGKASLYVYSGSIYMSKGGHSHTIQKFIRHEKYQYSFNWNDICLIRVSDPFIFDKNTQKAVLPHPDMPVASGDVLHVAGWGDTSPDSDITPDRLQKGLNYTAFSNEECRELITVPMIPGFLCAMGPTDDHGIYSGDSGGPLMKGKVLVGLTSFSYVPHPSGRPAVYTRVSVYIDWIKQKLGSEASELKFM